MRLSLGTTNSAKVEDVVWLCDIAEERGVQGLWIGDDIGGPNDIFTLTELSIMRTKTVNVGVGITSPLNHNISTIARAGTGLRELGGQRFLLGLGVGGLSDLAKRGIKVDNPVDTMRESVELLRRIWSRERVTSESVFKLDHYRLQWSPYTDIPLFLGVRGPKLLQLAGEISDGAIITGPLGYLKGAVTLLRSGMARRKGPRSEGRLEVVAWEPTIITRDDKDTALARETVAVVLSDMPQFALALPGANLGRVEEVRSTMVKFGRKRASELVTDDLIDAFSINGDAGAVCSKLRSLEKLGVTEVVFGPPYGRDMRSSVKALLDGWEAS